MGLMVILNVGRKRVWNNCQELRFDPRFTQTVLEQAEVLCKEWVES